MSSSNAPATNQPQPRTLSQHFSVDPATLTSLGLDPNQPASQIDQDTLTIIQDTLRMNGLDQRNRRTIPNRPAARSAPTTILGPAPRRRRRDTTHPTSAERRSSTAGPFREVLLENEEPVELPVFVPPPPVRHRIIMPIEDLTGDYLQNIMVEQPSHHSTQRPVFESWDRVEDRRPARGRRRNGQASVSTGSDDEEQLLQDSLTYEGLLAGEEVGSSFRQEADWGRR